MTELESAQATEGRDAKRPRKSGQEKNSGPSVPFNPLDPAALTKYSITGLHLSPGPVFGCRSAAVAHESWARVFYASGPHTYTTDIQLGSSNSNVTQGKDGILIPAQAQTSISPVAFSESASCEVQSLSACMAAEGARTALCSMDARACGRVWLLDNASTCGSEGAVSYELEPPAGSRLESGWAGSVLEEVAGSGGELCAHTAHHFARALHSYKGQQLVRSFYTPQAPTALALAPGEQGQLVCCAEEHMLSVWDVRQGEKGGLVQRMALASGGSPIYALAWSGASGGLLGAAGAERAVQVVDPRKWRVIAKWPSCTKYTVHYLAFSSAAPSWCYASGLDYELCAGQWNGSSGQTTGNSNSSHGGHGRAVGPAEFLGGDVAAATSCSGTKAGFGFRGCSRWLGMVRAMDIPGSGNGRDVVVAHTQNGSVYGLVCSDQKAA